MKKALTILVILAALSVAFIQVNTASAAGPAAPQGPGTPGDGRGPGAVEGPMHDLMVNAWADALGITEEDLQTRLDSGERIFEIAADLGFDDDEFTALAQDVHEKVKEAAIDQGLLTEEQAERMPGFGVPGASGRRQHMSDQDGLLHDYMTTALANALGMSVEDFEAARDEGKTLAEIAEAQGIDTDLRVLLHDAHEQAVEQAIKDGVIDESDAPLNGMGMGRGTGNQQCPGPGGRMPLPDTDNE